MLPSVLPDISPTRGESAFACAIRSLATVGGLRNLPPRCPRQDRRLSSRPGCAVNDLLLADDGQGQRACRKKTFDAAFAGVRPNLETAGPRHARRKGEDAEEAAPGRVRLARQLFCRKDHRRGDLRRPVARRQICQDAGRGGEAYGVPGEVVLAIWGRESGFGAAKIPYDAFEVLGTKAFLATRKEMFRTEVLAALVISTRAWSAAQAMKSSWAGALGQPQFLPTSFLKHAVDFDGDGTPDIWNSVPDTLASIANYLVDYGWVKGRDWGFEVTVPESVSCALEGPDQGKKISDWAAMGVSRINGKPFPESELKAEGFLLMPAGRNGPAFIVTPNFYVLKEYNESDLYALFIGHGADRIASGDKRFAGAWGKVGGLYRSDIAGLQRGLEKIGYDVGGADGLPGFKTRRSIGDWQAKNGRAATCFPDKDSGRGGEIACNRRRASTGWGNFEQLPRRLTIALQNIPCKDAGSGAHKSCFA